MVKSLKRLKLAAFASLVLAAQVANADTLFTNWSGGIVGGNLYTAGGPCAFACFALADNFSTQDSWAVTDITVYIVSFPSTVANPGWRYALFTTAGDQIVAPTDTAVTFTDLGNYFGPYEIYQGVISGLSINLSPGDYELRFTNTQDQGVYPAYGMSPSPQSLSPGFAQLTGSPTVEALLSTDRTQRSEEWAFEISGTTGPIFADGFDGP